MNPQVESSHELPRQPVDVISLVEPNQSADVFSFAESRRPVEVFTLEESPQRLVPTTQRRRNRPTNTPAEVVVPDVIPQVESSQELPRQQVDQHEVISLVEPTQPADVFSLAESRQPAEVFTPEESPQRLVIDESEGSMLDEISPLKSPQVFSRIFDGSGEGGRTTTRGGPTTTGGSTDHSTTTESTAESTKEEDIQRRIQRWKGM